MLSHHRVITYTQNRVANLLNLLSKVSEVPAVLWVVEHLKRALRLSTSHGYCEVADAGPGVL